MVAEEEEERDLEKNNPWIQDGSEADERQIWRGRRRSWGRAWERKIAARQAFVWLEFERVAERRGVRLQGDGPERRSGSKVRLHAFLGPIGVMSWTWVGHLVRPFIFGVSRQYN